MVREIIHIQVGQCGNRIGSRFWENISFERKNFSKGENPYDEVYFNETSDGQYIPRALLIGSDPDKLDQILTGADNQVYTYNYISGQINDNIRNWAEAHHAQGSEYGEKIFDFARKEVEKCDSFQGFQLCHSLGGGTGSGLGTFIINGLHDEYPDRQIITFSVVPSPRCSELSIQPYNFILSLHQIAESVGEVMCLDNDAIFNICQKDAHLSTPTYGDMNYYISTVMSNFTCPFRFPSQFNSDLNKTVAHLVPFERLHFTISNFAPLSTRASLSSHSYTVKELSEILLDYRYLLADCNPRNAKCFAASAFFRSRSIKLEDVYKEMINEKTQNIPRFKMSVCNIPCMGIPLFASLVQNTSAIKEIFSRISEQFHKLYVRRASIHQFVNDGLEIAQFDEAFEEMKDNIYEYEFRGFDSNSDDELLNKFSFS